jgi:signal transduction histidine kinase
VLNDRGLVDALTSLVALAAIPCDLQLKVACDARFGQQTEKTLYFTASEAMANITKHSGATRAEVVLEEVAGDPGQLVLTVRDNGRDGAKVVPGHGLEGLRIRLEAVGGSLRLDSPDGSGTVLIAAVPLTEGD